MTMYCTGTRISIVFIEKILFIYLFFNSWNSGKAAFQEVVLGLIPGRRNCLGFIKTYLDIFQPVKTYQLSIRAIRIT